MSVSGIPFGSIPNFEIYLERHADELAFIRYKKTVEIVGNCLWAISYSTAAYYFFEATTILDGEDRAQRCLRIAWVVAPILWALGNTYREFPQNPGEQDLMQLDWQAFTFVIQQATTMPREGANVPHGIFQVIKTRLPECPPDFLQECDITFLDWIRDDYTIFDGSTTRSNSSSER